MSLSSLVYEKTPTLFGPKTVLPNGANPRLDVGGSSELV